MTAQTAAFAPGDLIDITLDDDYDAQMKFNVFWVRGGAEQPWISPPTNLVSRHSGEQTAVKIRAKDKRRGTMDISDTGKEALIHWNGPPLAKADSICEAAINRIFKGGRFCRELMLFVAYFFRPKNMLAY